MSKSSRRTALTRTSHPANTSPVLPHSHPWGLGLSAATDMHSRTLTGPLCSAICSYLAPFKPLISRPLALGGHPKRPPHAALHARLLPPTPIAPAHSEGEALLLCGPLTCPPTGTKMLGRDPVTNATLPNSPNDDPRCRRCCQCLRYWRCRLPLATLSPSLPRTRNRVRSPPPPLGHTQHPCRTVGRCPLFFLASPEFNNCLNF